MRNLLKKGISIRNIHIWLIIVSVIVSGTVVYSTYSLSRTFSHITQSSRDNTELLNAAHELMDASDYLTEQVQRFSLDGNMRFLELYFSEAFERQRREEAISKMTVDPKTSAALKHLQGALSSSMDLMNIEYYSMRLVIAAQGYTDYPEILNTIKLTSEDKALSAEDKMRRANELVLNDDYYEQKDKIRREMRESLEEIDKLAKANEAIAYASLNRDMIIVRIVIVAQTIIILLMLWLTSHLGVDPILQAVDKIRTNSPIPEVGANEFKYLAQAYNKMYSKNKSSLERLNFQVSHDELTGAYNRTGYDFLLEHIDLPSTYMMLIDVDNFKKINDSFGHEIGDRVLVKLVTVLKGVFRDDDCICRIGGDEFVVFMVHSSGMPRRSIEAKIEQINNELVNTTDGLPPISISIGIVNGKDANDTASLFEKTDAAMYESKKQGKNTYTFVE